MTARRDRTIDRLFLEQSIVVVQNHAKEFQKATDVHTARASLRLWLLGAEVMLFALGLPRRSGDPGRALMDALEALDFGRTHPVLKAKKQLRSGRTPEGKLAVAKARAIDAVRILRDMKAAPTVEEVLIMVSAQNGMKIDYLRSLRSQVLAGHGHAEVRAELSAGPWRHYDEFLVALRSELPQQPKAAASFMLVLLKQDRIFFAQKKLKET